MSQNTHAIRQAVFLVGGRGSRLGQLTEYIPKPLLPVGGVSFIEGLIRYVARFGINRVLLLAGYGSEVVEEYFRTGVIQTPSGTVRVRIICEREPQGTAGALLSALDGLDDEFLVFNGDSFFAVDLIQFLDSFNEDGTAMALRRVTDSERFGVVEIDQTGRVTKFAERGEEGRAGLVNAGIYRFRRCTLEKLRSVRIESLERELIPRLISERRLFGIELAGRFVDIGTPESLAEAQRCNPFRLPAVFFDRDGVLNRDHGYISTFGEWEWCDGAIEAIRYFNRSGYLVFVITNQAGVARGYYTEEAIRTLHKQVNDELRENRAHIDDFRYCPHHPDGALDEYRRKCSWRKPNPGMLEDLAACWPVDLENSLLVGDKESDLRAAQHLGIEACLFRGGNLIEKLRADGYAG